MCLNILKGAFHECVNKIKHKMQCLIGKTHYHCYNLFYFHFPSPLMHYKNTFLKLIPQFQFTILLQRKQVKLLYTVIDPQKELLASFQLEPIVYCTQWPSFLTSYRKPFQMGLKSVCHQILPLGICFFNLLNKIHHILDSA